MPPSPAPDARAIAERLNGAQADAMRRRVFEGYLLVTQLRDMGLIDKNHALTEWGLAVRAELLAMEGRGDGSL